MRIKQELRESITHEWNESSRALLRNDYTGAWHHLERAHILAQKNPWLHTVVHFKMLACAVRQRNLVELFGQLHRMAVAAPASLLRILPVGNVGSSRVSPYIKMDIPMDLRKILDRAR
ncbi:MAG: DUF3703 domain-containing protein [Pseudobdellovibrionaceae bacterium]|nr:DUF3703 domain-containing protein [Pseudobdellovibrionaceae bacterium]